MHNHNRGPGAAILVSQYINQTASEPTLPSLSSCPNKNGCNGSFNYLHISFIWHKWYIIQTPSECI